MKRVMLSTGHFVVMDMTALICEMHQGNVSKSKILEIWHGRLNAQARTACLLYEVLYNIFSDNLSHLRLA